MHRRRKELHRLRRKDRQPRKDQRDGLYLRGGDDRGRRDDLGLDDFYQRPFSARHLPRLKALRPSEPDEHTLPTLVREGATIGAGCTIGNDLEIGRWAMIGMGSLVTKTRSGFSLAIGSPARSIGAVCKCGQLFHKFEDPKLREVKL